MKQGINKQYVKIVQAITINQLEIEINKVIQTVSHLYNLKDCRVTKQEVGAFATLIFEEIPDDVEISESDAKARNA